MDQVIDFFKHLFSTRLWPARWSCGRWTDFHGWLYISSSLLIWVAYFTIPFALYHFLRKRGNVLPFTRIFWLFILFIFACGITHFMDVLMFWFPAYRLSAVLLFITAMISLAAVAGLIKIMPLALTLRSPAELEEIIKQRTIELQQSNEYLKRVNCELDHFVYTASHDLKSPINNVDGLFRLMKKNIAAGKPASDELMAKAEQSITRINDSIGRLTDIIKVRHNTYDDIETISFESIIDEILIENEQLLAQNQVQVKKQLEVATVHYSATAAKSIIYNLVTNGAKYIYPGRHPEIVITTYQSNEGQVVLTVKDNGVGIDLAKDHDKLFMIFRRFYTLGEVEGTGIGLFMIKRLIEDKGGMLELESEPGVGSVFKVTF